MAEKDYKVCIVEGEVREPSFDNETENGKLYISYPMVEALRDFEEGICGEMTNCFVPLSQLMNYKTISASRIIYQHFKNYDFPIWKNIMEVFALRLSCLMNQYNTINYDEYITNVTPLKIFQLENQEIRLNRVFVLSAFPEFLLDYFGRKLWHTTVKRSNNALQRCEYKVQGR